VKKETKTDWGFNLGKNTILVFIKIDVNIDIQHQFLKKPMLTIDKTPLVFIQTDINVSTRHQLLKEPILTNSTYLQLCPHTFFNIGFYKTNVKMMTLKEYFLVVMVYI